MLLQHHPAEQTFRKAVDLTAAASALRPLFNQQSAYADRRCLMGRGILLWLLGVPIPLVILILLFWR
ncbi:MAG TPA: hypothetical protein DIC56_19155 [Rhizobium sp.]|nr:hypothetical protein [Rhizobium sp.]